MDVVLDTNILREDFWMRSGRFKVLFDYLKKTQSRIIMPKIVYQEIAAVYERELTSRVKEFKDSKHKLEKALIGGSVQDYNIEIKGEVDKYLTFLKEKLEISNNDIVSYKDNYLDEITKRAIWRIKPCSEKGKEFRDTLLWLTVLDIAGTDGSKMILFISRNTKQFASDDGCLHPTLVMDTENKGVIIKYCSSMKYFAEAHATTVDYITSEWLVSAISLNTINTHVCDMLNKSGTSRLLKQIESDIFYAEPTGYVLVFDSSVRLDSFYVYEMTDGSIYVEALYKGEVEVEFESEEEVESWEYDYVDPEEGCFPPPETKAIMKYSSPEIQVTFGITIRNKDVQAFEIVEWGFI